MHGCLAGHAISCRQNVLLTESPSSELEIKMCRLRHIHDAIHIIADPIYVVVIVNIPPNAS